MYVKLILEKPQAHPLISYNTRLRCKSFQMREQENVSLQLSL
jgi:hypothetical protein